jgi:hypothetical protein
MAWLSVVQLILLILAVLAVLGTLFWGIFTMARGGAYNSRWSNKIMRYRVALQGIALLIFVTILLMASRG